jgi:hypothetical protein
MCLLYQVYASTILCICKALVGGILTYIISVNKKERKSKQTHDSIMLKPHIYRG